MPTLLKPTLLEVSDDVAQSLVLVFDNIFHFVDGEVLVLTLQKYTEAGQTFTKVRLQCESMDLAADVVQDMAKFFKWNELDSEADFPTEFDAFQEVITTVAECNAARMNLTADMADDSQRIKVSNYLFINYRFVAMFMI